MSKKSESAGTNGSKPKRETEPKKGYDARIVTTFSEDEIKVEMEGFANLTPRRIQRSIGQVLREWKRHQRVALHEYRVAEEAKKQAEQQVEEETVNA